MRFLTTFKDQRMQLWKMAEAETTQGVEAFMSDPEAIRMRQEAGVDTDNQEVVSAVSEYHIFQN